MKLMTLDMVLESVLLVGKIIGRVKKGVYDIALISHVNYKELKYTRLFDVKVFSV